MIRGSGEEKTGEVIQALRFLRQQLIPDLTDMWVVVPSLLYWDTAPVIFYSTVAVLQGNHCSGSVQLSSGSREALAKRVGMTVQMSNLL